MTAWTFAPSLGWIPGILLALLMLGFALAGPILYKRAGSTTDTSILSVVRRSSIALLLALIALTPSQLQTVTNRAVNATDVYIAVDVTGSMAVQDAHYGSPQVKSRLDAARQAVDDIVRTYPDASFAAVHFGANSTLDVPITPDGRAISNWAQGLRTEPTSLSAGSSLDAPIAPLTMSMKSLKDQHPQDRIILYVITDGEQTSSANRRSFSTLRAYLNDAFTIGVGSPEGGRVPVSKDSNTQPPTEGQGQEWVSDPQTGQPGISKLDEGTLKTIADEMSGHYIGTSATSTAVSGPSTKASHEYRVSATDSKQQRIIPVVWPLVFAVLALLAWELLDWIRLSERLL
ncbi:hypothetical protein KIM372_06520 [Bombiscardovia nodaiensis]|uniref:VWFA domain-containing protein n=1 Tax=Bombiscardovia nodaiensis TaxID=2932181 RepID=A0ABN6SD32_9BIFI|nr:hypothetical protein KIM372_06520 [Bombiscardovia nodaiensis]